MEYKCILCKKVSHKLTRNEILALAAGAGKFKFDMQPCISFNYPADFQDTKWRYFFLEKTGISPPENSKDIVTNLGFAYMKIPFDLDDGVKVNYGTLGNLLAEKKLLLERNDRFSGWVDSRIEVLYGDLKQLRR